MRPSQPLFDQLAADYDRHFDVPHRRAYDDLAWEHTCALLPASPGLVIDAGCGVGRWATRLIGLGHRVIGIEQAPAMIAGAHARELGPRFTLVRGSMDEAELSGSDADLVLAMGSMQYTADPARTIARFATWVRPGGAVCVLVDSRVALAAELLAVGKTAEAFERLESGIGVWTQKGLSAELHLLDRARLEAAFGAAGLVDVQARGLLVGASVFGRDVLIGRLADGYAGQLELERRLSAYPLLVDLGKQILISGRRSSTP